VRDLWYRSLTPDTQFPAEVRRLVVCMLAACAPRIRAVNLGALLVRDVCDVLVEQLELYRRVHDRHVLRRLFLGTQPTSLTLAVDARSIGEETLARLAPEARDRALSAEMAADGDLLAAAAGPEAEHAALRRIMDGFCPLVLPQTERDSPLLRALARELLAGYVFRPVMGFFAPFWINKLLLSALRASALSASKAASPGAAPHRLAACVPLTLG
jgi:sorting nexin-13